MEVNKSCNVIENEQPVMSSLVNISQKTQEYSLKGKVINCGSHYYGSEDRELTIGFHKLELSINDERKYFGAIIEENII